jgi:hypothetical protein
VGRIGGFLVQSRYDSRDLTKAARAAFLSKFERDVDPDSTLPPIERERRAKAARSAHFARMAYLSSKARTNRTAA